ncbi:TlpA family protein disulfide reductase [Niabella hirudinis]|uniref:TlpA family protein disulfide reductase n=1 Tax=Niabella hirudinis TaxID=1285929 RepID=UPI003EBABCC9
MKNYLKATLISLLVFVSLFAYSADSSYIRFVFSKNLNVDKFSLTLNDGINEHKINLQSTSSWSGILLALYGYVSIEYKKNDTMFVTKNVFFKKGYSELYLNALPDSIKSYAIDEKKSVNIFTYERLGGAELDLFVKEKVDIRKSFIQKHKHLFGIDTSIRNKAVSLSDSVLYRELAFVKKFPEYYISFWLFQKDIIKTDLSSPDTLLEIYNNILPAKYKQSKSAEHTVSVLRNKIVVSSNLNFPDFLINDIHGNKIELSKLKGNYVLIQVWASWCKPCIEEMPSLKEINNLYGNKNFKLISFSVDQDSAAFTKAVEGYTAAWTNVLSDVICNLLGRVYVPQLYLIDEKGISIYDRDKIKDFDLSALKKILADRFEK